MRSQAEVLDRAKAEVKLPDPPAGMSGLPTTWAQDAIGAKGLVIVVFLVRLLHRATQAAMQRQRVEIMQEIGRYPGGIAQAEMARNGPAP